MRYSTSIAALALAYLQGSAALNNAIARKFSLLAEMGLNPDGSPMEFVPTVADGADSTIKTTFKEFKVSSANSNSVSVSAVNETIVPEYVELPIDNFAEEKGHSYSWQGTFYNRYWVSTKSYKPGSPVFIYDVGEADAGPNALFRLQNETSFFKQIVDQYNGIGIVWEHRFYGNSSPVPVDVNTPASDFEFLTTEQSLADVDRFAKQFSRKNIKYDLTPKNTPWVFVGGSYPGMRAAFIRNMYPETIYASYASSAPVQASVDQSFYFEPVWQGLNAYGFGNCSSDIHAAILYMDKIMSSSNTTAAANLKIQFLGLGAENNSHATFADALSTIFYAWQSYGVEGGSSGLRQFCDWLEQDTDGLMPKVAGADGLAKSKGPAYVVDRWAKFPYFVPNVNSNLETECSGKKNVKGDCNLDLKFTDPSLVAWTWQYCTQWGFFQSANLGDHQLVSKFNSLQHQHDICHRQFPDATPSQLPDWPDVNRTNRVFGGWSIRPSNTYWSNGEFDPWRTLSPASGEPFAPHPHLFNSPPTQCGKTTSKNELFGYVIPNAQHCYDFRTTFAGGAISRKYFTDALTSWLKCFKPGGAKPGYGSPSPKPGPGGYGKPWKA